VASNEKDRSLPKHQGVSGSVDKKPPQHPEAQNAVGSVAFVRALYRSYESETPTAWFDRRYSARMQKLIANDKKATPEGDAGTFDWDPIINAQDRKLSDIEVTLVSHGDDRAVVDARFHNLGSDQQLRYGLVREGGLWVIDDLQSLKKPRWTMSKLLVRSHNPMR